MAENPHKGLAEFEHDGEVMVLKLSTSALIEAERETGISALHMIPAKLDHLAVLVALLRAGLRHGCSREISVDEAGDLLDECGEAVTRAIFRAVGFALPEKKPGDTRGGDSGADPRGAAKKRGTGRKS